MIQYQPYEPVGENLYNELKIDDSGITITCEGLRSSGKAFIEAIKHYNVPSCSIDLGTLNLYNYEEKKEGKNMKLLNMYVEKSQDNIRKYYHNLEDMEKLAEKYNESNTPNGSYLTEDCGDYDFHYMVSHKTTEKEEMYMNLCNEEFKQLREKIEEVQAQLEIITNDENSSYHDINYVLHNYGIIDDNGKLTPYNPTFVDEEAPVKEAPKKAGRPKKVSE